MAASPILTRPSRTAAPRRWIRAQALALALLLLVTQQWGLAHWLQHRAAGGDATQRLTASAAAVAVADAATHQADAAADGASDGAADSVCAICLALAGLGAAALPQWPVWVASALPQVAPMAGALPAPRPAAATPFQARAPPVLS